ncbi:hypothetical protein Tco_0475204 [Tanacetum coccineum]
MELKDIVSSSLRKDMKELRSLQEKNAKSKEECNENIQGIKTCVERINPRSYYYYEIPFKVLFGEEFNSFRERFVRVMDRLESQLDKEEFHAYDSKTCLEVLKGLFETSLYQKPDMNTYSSILNFEREVKEFENYTGYSTQSLKDKIFAT